MKIWVLSRDGGCEGQSLGVIAFHSLDAARAWKAGQEGAWCIAEVPVYPEIPTKPWFSLEAVE